MDVLSTDPPHADYLRDIKANVHAMGPGGAYGYSFRFDYWLKIHANDYDLIIVNGLWQYPSFAIWLACQSWLKKYVVIPHGMLDPWFNRAPIKYLKKFIYWQLIERQVIRDADLVLFTAQEEFKRARLSFRPYRAKKEAVVPMGVAAPQLKDGTEINLFYAAFPQLVNKRFLLFLGRIHEKKGIDLLLSAFATVAAADKNLFLVIAGPSADNYGKRLQNRFKAKHRALKDKVVWTGMLTDQLKNGALRAADVLVLPSHQENFAYSVVESLSFGTPVLISNRVNIWREIEAFGAGLVEPDTGDGITSLLKRWLALEKRQRDLMHERALSCFKEKFEITSSLKQLIPLFADLIDNH